MSRSGDDAQEPEPETEGTDISGVDMSEDYFRVPDKRPEGAGRRVDTEGIDWAKIDSLRRSGSDVDSVTTVYRVQLFASQYYSEAGYEMEVAEDVFSEPVYLLYEVPYYKLLLGNCTDEACGRRLLGRARSLGYENGWLVESPPDSIYFDFILPPDSLRLSDSTFVDSAAVVPYDQ